MHRVGARERCAFVSWFLRVGPKRIKSRQERTMWASHGIARCSSHDVSILLHTFSAHKCIFQEPVPSLNALLRGPVGRLAVLLTKHSPQFAHKGRSIWVATGAVGGKVGGKEGDSVGSGRDGNRSKN